MNHGIPILPHLHKNENQKMNLKNENSKTGYQKPKSEMGYQNFKFNTRGMIVFCEKTGQILILKPKRYKHLNTTHHCLLIEFYGCDTRGKVIANSPHSKTESYFLYVESHGQRL